MPPCTPDRITCSRTRKRMRTWHLLAVSLPRTEESSRGTIRAVLWGLENLGEMKAFRNEKGQGVVTNLLRARTHFLHSCNSSSPWTFLFCWEWLWFEQLLFLYKNRRFVMVILTQIHWTQVFSNTIQQTSLRLLICKRFECYSANFFSGRSYT